MVVDISGTITEVLGFEIPLVLNCIVNNVNIKLVRLEKVSP